MMPVQCSGERKAGTPVGGVCLVIFTLAGLSVLCAGAVPVHVQILVVDTRRSRALLLFGHHERPGREFYHCSST